MLHDVLRTTSEIFKSESDVLHDNRRLMYNMFAVRGTTLYGVTCTPIVGLLCFNVAYGRCVCFLMIGFACVLGARELGVFVTRLSVVLRWNIMIMLGFVTSCNLGRFPIYLCMARC